MKRDAQPPAVCLLVWVTLLLLTAISTTAWGQDTFEVQVYEYATVPRGLWNLETHANYTLRGTRTNEGSVAPTNHQTHLTFELTRGITEYFEVAGYLVFAQRPGDAPEFAGYRFRPRVRAPESWGMPVMLSLSLEVGFPRPRFEAATTTFELRPIIERAFGRWQLDVNPTLGRSLRGPGSGDGWDFEPGARVAFAATPAVDLSMEYYGSLGPVDRFAPGADQVHLFFPGADIALGRNQVFNIGIGFNARETGPRTMLKARLGWLFGGAQQ